MPRRKLEQPSTMLVANPILISKREVEVGRDRSVRDWAEGETSNECGGGG